ncbi:uncharacterized protein LY89DRAFT_787787 [Mollisia scopiformis]|uniref:Rhodopsin domain-containing protein n=1 Tax=Mollisia scopiformis TaxID=149040 RepID=A0A132BCQ3_MOLSC|nr:uncharacterized protein LY89DRAFT_787787 [Mollisia scopiformis]KUJ10158.1 hypothetical protein LY89DRAFT_787787 [Mollisia scopiformis]
MTVYNAYHWDYTLLAAFCIPIATIAVILRFVARARTQQKYGYEDWFAVVSLLFFLAFCGCLIWGGNHGSGYSPLELPYPVLVKFLKAEYASGLLIPASMMAAKNSILFLYARIFSIDRSFSISIRIVGFLNIIWFIAATLGLVFQCRPVHKAWDPIVPGKCFNYAAFMLGIEIPNSLLDFVMMALPISMLREMRISVREKIILVMIFMLGGMVGIIGFIRIALVYKSVQSNLHELGLWVGIQTVMAVFCCCVPTYRPFIKGMKLPKSITSRYASMLGQRTGSSKTRSNKSSQNSDPYSKPHLTDGSYDLGNLGHEESVLTRVEVGSMKDNHSSYPMKTVNVESTVEMV